MKRKRERLVDFEIDKLTNSIENVRTEETFDTEIIQLKVRDIKLIHKADWLFDWKTEIKDKSKEVYKLSTVNNPSVIQGLVSIEERIKFISVFQVILWHLLVKFQKKEDMKGLSLSIQKRLW